MHTYTKSHMGHIRGENQDMVLARKLGEDLVLLAVADGAGGESAGGLASSLAFSVLDLLNPLILNMDQHLAELIYLAHETVRQRAEGQPELQGMGSTMTLAVIDQLTLYWAHVGDSRLYVFRGATLRRISSDHTIPGQMEEDGELGEVEARKHPMKHVLLDCVGCERCEPEYGRMPLELGDIVLICSDGLHGEVADTGMTRLLSQARNLEQSVEGLVQAALNSGGADNVSVAAAHVF